MTRRTPPEFEVGDLCYLLRGSCHRGVFLLGTLSKAQG